MSLDLRLLGAIGDIHAEDRMLEEAIACLREDGAQLLCSTGDVVDGAGDVERCCQALIASEVLVVRGNHDRWMLAGRARDLPEATQPAALGEAALAYLRGLPVTLEIATPHGSLLLCHGLGANDMGGLKPEDEGYALQNNAELQTLVRRADHRFILGGHTHRPMVRHFGSVSVLNPGTLARGEGPGFMLIDFEAGSIRHYTWGDDGLLHVSELPLLS
jgi:putative phosphoesterase